MVRRIAVMAAVGLMLTGAAWADGPRNLSTDRPAMTPIPGTVAQACCMRCSKGCPCGNSCISCAKTCRVGPGCACTRDGAIQGLLRGG